MAWYEIKFFIRVPGGPGAGRRVDSAIFEAADDTAAKSEAYRRLNATNGDFATLETGAGDHVWTGERRNA